MSKKKVSKRKRYGSAKPGLIITLILLVLAVVLAVLVVNTQMLTMNLLVPILVIVFLFVLLIFLLTHRTGKRAKFVFGVILAVIMAVIMIYAIMVLAKLTGTFNKIITDTKTETSYVGVYVLTDDEAQTITDVKDDAFGIMESLDRTSTDGAITQIEDALDADITTAEYSGLSTLADALLAQDCRSIILNEAYLDVLADMDGYEDFEDGVREIATYTVETEVEDEEEKEVSETAFVVYISGVDSRNGLVAKSRSDVNILAVVNRDTHQVLLVSTPRDYFVPLSISNGQEDKLTHAGIYGVNVSMDTLAMLYGIDVDYYFRVSFDGFEDIIDALGGVDVYSDYTFTSTLKSSYSYTEGYNTLDGEAALYFVRERKAFSAGDIQRGKDQMAVIKAIINKAMSPAILKSYSAVLDAAGKNAETDVPYDLIASVVNDQLKDGGSWDVITYTVTGTGASKVPYSMSSKAYVMIPDEETVATAKELMQSVLDGETIEQP